MDEGTSRQTPADIRRDSRFRLLHCGRGTLGASIAGTLALQVLYGHARRAVLRWVQEHAHRGSLDAGRKRGALDRSDYDRRRVTTLCAPT